MRVSSAVGVPRRTDGRAMNWRAKKEVPVAEDEQPCNAMRGRLDV